MTCAHHTVRSKSILSHRESTTTEVRILVNRRTVCTEIHVKVDRWPALFPTSLALLLGINVEYQYSTVRGYMIAFLPFNRIISFWLMCFRYDCLALLCATAQHSYCHVADFRRPSVKPRFSETVKRINTNFRWEVPTCIHASIISSGGGGANSFVVFCVCFVAFVLFFLASGLLFMNCYWC